MKFSIIICTLNRNEFLKNAVNSIFNQSYDNYEIIIVDQSDTINKEKYLKDDRVNYIHINMKGLSNARNVGLESATGDYIVLMDDDSEFHINTLSIVNDCLIKKDYDILCGIIKDKNNGKLFNSNMPDKCCFITYDNFMSFPSASQFIKKSLFDDIKFDDKFGLGRYYGSSEESDVFIQFLYSNKIAYYNPKIVVFHPYPDIREISDEKLYSYAIGYGAFVRKHLELFNNKKLYKDFKINILKKYIMIILKIISFNFKEAKLFKNIIKHNKIGFKKYNVNEESNIMVSVLMCSYKTSEKQLKESINSILNQTYKNIEFVIIVDGDKENYNFIKKINDPRIKLYYNDSNLGLTKSLNKGLKLCQGSFIARMDSDDISISNRIENELKFILRNKLDLVSMNSLVFGDNDGISINVLSTNKKIKQQLMYESVFIHPTVMIKNSFLRKNNLSYDPKDEYRYTEDYAMWITCSKYGKLGICSDIGLKYRVHSSQISNTKSKEQLENRKKLYALYGKYYNIKINEKLNNELYNGKTDNLKMLAGQIIEFTKKYPEYKEVLYYKYLLMFKNSKKVFFDYLSIRILRLVINSKNIKNMINYYYRKLLCRKDAN